MALPKFLKGKSVLVSEVIGIVVAVIFLILILVSLNNRIQDLTNTSKVLTQELHGKYTPGSSTDNGAGSAGGSTGNTGPQGIPGPSGMAGVQGPQGLSGIQGIPGISGVPGKNGVNGTNGANGVSGFQLVMSNFQDLAANATGTVSGYCPSGKKALAVSCYEDSPSANNVYLKNEYIYVTGNGGYCTYYNGTGAYISILAQVTCATAN